jgi:hypothetical protein
MCQGTGKIGYDTAQAALPHLLWVKGHTPGKKACVYRCPECGSWHVGRGWAEIRRLRRRRRMAGLDRRRGPMRLRRYLITAATAALARRAG